MRLRRHGHSLARDGGQTTLGGFFNFAFGSDDACSVDNDDDARWFAQRCHSSFSGPVDVNPRLPGDTCQARKTVGIAAQHRLRPKRNVPILLQLGHRARRVVARRRFELGFRRRAASIRFRVPWVRMRAFRSARSLICAASSGRSVSSFSTTSTSALRPVRFDGPRSFSAITAAGLPSEALWQ